MADFFRVLPLQFGSLTRDLVALVMGAGRRARHPRLVAVGADLPHPLTRRDGVATRRRDGATRRRETLAVPLSPVTGTPHAGWIDRWSQPTPTHARVTSRPTPAPRPATAGRAAAPRRIPFLADLDRARRHPGRLGPVPVRLLARAARPPLEPGTPAVGGRGVPAVLGHLPRDRRPLRRRRGRPDAARPGRDPGDDRARSATRTRRT